MTLTSKTRGIRPRIVIGLLAVVASIAVVACKASGSAEASGTVDLPLVPPIEWKVSAKLGKYTVDGGDTRANQCLQITWSDKDGAELSSDTVETDGNGSASGQVPKGAVRWEIKSVPCPEPDPTPDPGSGGMLVIPQQNYSPSKVREFVVYGSPIIPSQASGADNLTYSFSVRATSWAQVDSLIGPIIAGGIGTPVPPSVEVILYSTMEAGVAGGRLVSGMPGHFTDWSFDFNGGAFTADLSSSHNTINYQIGSWDVVETVIPLQDFDFGLTMGVVYSNDGAMTFETDRLLGPVSANYRFDFSN